MRLSRCDIYTISDDLVLGIPGDSSSDGCSVGSLESIEAPDYSPFTSDDNASDCELETERLVVQTGLSIGIPMSHNCATTTLMTASQHSSRVSCSECIEQ